MWTFISVHWTSGFEFGWPKIPPRELLLFWIPKCCSVSLGRGRHVTEGQGLATRCVLTTGYWLVSCECCSRYVKVICVLHFLHLLAFFVSHLAQPAVPVFSSIDWLVETNDLEDCRWVDVTWPRQVFSALMHSNLKLCLFCIQESKTSITLIFVFIK